MINTSDYTQISSVSMTSKNCDIFVHCVSFLLAIIIEFLVDMKDIRGRNVSVDLLM